MYLGEKNIQSSWPKLSCYSSGIGFMDKSSSRKAESVTTTQEEKKREEKMGPNAN